MKKKISMFLALCWAVMGVALIAGEDAKLKKIIAGDHRSEEEKARDKYRHPYEVMQFFGLKDDMTVVEIYPGGGWYTQILAPYLKDNGKLIAGLFDTNPETQKEWQARYNKVFLDKFTDKQDMYGAIKTVGISFPGGAEFADPGTVDLIIDARNVHNWIANGDDMVKSYHRALKKGGVAGIVEHRRDPELGHKDGVGYILEQTIIDLFKKHGFKLAAKSEINANPKDTSDHPRGVWTLPPTLALQDEDRDKYVAIGESDRMTLKFVKE